jgi:hypothetical protein
VGGEFRRPRFCRLSIQQRPETVRVLRVHSRCSSKALGFGSISCHGIVGQVLGSRRPGSGFRAPSYHTARTVESPTSGDNTAVVDASDRQNHVDVGDEKLMGRT